MELEWWQAVVLGLVQGLTEFIPVSSSGHLVLVPFLAGWPKPAFAFDAAVHAGTAVALLVAFREEVRAAGRGLTGGRDADARLGRRLAALAALGTLPLVVIALTVRPLVEQLFQSPTAAATGLLGTAAILVGGEGWRRRRVRRATTHSRAASGRHAPEAIEGGSDEPAAAGSATPDAPSPIPVGLDSSDPRGRGLDQLGIAGALAIGAAQGLAVMPGISRSGSTIMAGVATGLTRQAATRFAFLLALPALAGASALSALDLLTEPPGPEDAAVLAAAVATAFVAGLAAIRLLLRLVARTSLTGFAGYCVAASITGWVAIVVLGAGGG